MSQYIKIKLLVTTILIAHHLMSNGQRCYWQQRADYEMSYALNENDHTFKGKQKITYTNNSPDTIDRIYFHLYLNAFQPGSLMDVKSLNIKDPDRRVGDRISKLTKSEYGIQKVNKLFCNGDKVTIEEEGTILEGRLSKPILPGEKVIFTSEFEGQIPIQIRRTGRNNKEGIDYSMAQWYPKICEYDENGWHPNPYVAREFYGVWGDFDVKLTLNSKYVVAASGILQNNSETEKGYSNSDVATKSSKTTWHFKAENVHDFVWAADPDYTHITKKSYNGTLMHFFYQPGEKTTENWTLLPEIMDVALKYMNETFGVYPYPSYSFIQGGDGGMEYAMATLILGEGKLSGLVGLAVHEWIHSWYQHVIGTNESLYGWMDEGFTSYAETKTMEYLKSRKMIPGEVSEFPWKETAHGYSQFYLAGRSEPLSTHADHFITNAAYGVGSYTKGELFLTQLDYIIGSETFNRGMKKYFNVWKFKHPNDNDFLRIMEKESGMVLDWYKEYWINTLHHPDYAIDSIYDNKLILKKIGLMPMPLDVLVTIKSGKKELYHIPLDLMRGAKSPDISHDSYELAKDWPWINSTYILDLKCKENKIERIEIDPSFRLVDTDRINNVWPAPILEKEEKK